MTSVVIVDVEPHQTEIEDMIQDPVKYRQHAYEVALWEVSAHESSPDEDDESRPCS